MQGKQRLNLWVATIIILLSVVLFWANYSGIIELHQMYGPFLLHHWFSLIGASFIALYTPIYYYLKRKKPESMRAIMNLHIHGNLISFALISLHFSNQISRPAEFFPDLQTGLTLYPIVIILVLTGYLMRFRVLKIPWKNTKFLHVSLTIAFYFIIWVHILHGLGLINVHINH